MNLTKRQLKRVSDALLFEDTSTERETQTMTPRERWYYNSGVMHLADMLAKKLNE